MKKTVTTNLRKISAIVKNLLEWYQKNARDLPWRREPYCKDPYCVYVSEIMLQQTQVKTVLPFWERWMRELPTIEAVAKASPDKIHKLWEGLGYYTRVRNLQKAAQQIVAECKKRRLAGTLAPPCEFPRKFEEVLALPGIGRYTAGAICSIAFNEPRPILDGNVVRVLTRIFGIEKDPRERETNGLLWEIAEELVESTKECSHLNQSLMELGALVCAPRNPQCLICPVKKLCVAFQENRTDALPNIGKREAATARRFVAFVVEHRGKFLVRQRPEKVVNAHLWEFPNVETNGNTVTAADVFKSQFGFSPPELLPLLVVKHSITRYRITLEAFRVPLKNAPKTTVGKWLSHAKFDAIAFTAAHKKLANFEVNRILSGR
jgi:A/G-specific adenine glycosylase